MGNNRRVLRRYTRKEIIRNRILVAVAVLGVLAVLFGLFRFIFKKDKDKEKEPPTSPSVQDSAQDTAAPPQPQENPKRPVADYVTTDDPYYEKEEPLLVGPENPIPQDFKPDVADLGNGYQFDKNATEALNDMIAAAKSDGIALWLLSAYRSTESQEKLYQNKVQEYRDQGFSEADANLEAALWVAVPGTSEHSIGLAVDLNSLEESFEKTPAFEWLQKYAGDYGFILRFPKDKEDITKISYEPWHYRYVGTNHAKAMEDSGLCLEEYIRMEP